MSDQVSAAAEVDTFVAQSSDGQWYAMVRVDGRSLKIGYFSNQYQAQAALSAAHEYHASYWQSK
ncbi:hypothetical protein [Xanthomonas phage vB_XooS_NR08]|nr:hypothetical protein [Xanthomonas phage vB_XooS_NR08]